MGHQRRNFLKLIGAAAAGAPLVAVAGTTLGEPGPALNPDPPQPGLRPYELFHGFLLIDDKQPIPEFVQAGALEQSLGCGLGGDTRRRKTTFTEMFGSPEALAAELTFTMYGFQRLPFDVRVGACSLRRHQSGRIMHANIAYQQFDLELGDWVTSLSVFAQTSYARPYPIVSSPPLEPGEPGVIPAKTDILPGPGLHISTGSGDSYHWIDADVLYHIDIQNNDSLPAADELIAKLSAL